MSAISLSIFIICAIVMILLNGEMISARSMLSDQVPTSDRVPRERLYEHRVNHKKAKRSPCLIQEEGDKEEQRRTTTNRIASSINLR